MSKLWSQPQATCATLAGFTGDIEISKIRQSKNLRVDMNQIEELAQSLQHKGLLQPILVRTMDGYFEVVAGNRRFSACKSLGWKKIACHVIELDDKEAFEVSLVENIQRKRLTALEEAKAFKAYVSDYGWGGITELAAKIGKSIGYVTKRIKLLNLPVDILDSITNNNLNISVAQELSPIRDKEKQSVLANLIIERRLSLRRVSKLVNVFRTDGIDVDDYDNNHTTNHIDHIKIAERSFDKTITVIRIAMNSLTEIIESIEHDWVVYEALMQHRNMLHTQIDILIKEKRKL